MSCCCLTLSSSALEQEQNHVLTSRICISITSWSCSYLSLGPKLGGYCLVSLLDLWPKTPFGHCSWRFFCLSHGRASTPGAPCLEQCLVFWWGHSVVLQGSTLVQRGAHTRLEVFHQSLSAPCPCQGWKLGLYPVGILVFLRSTWKRLWQKGRRQAHPCFFATSWWGRCTCSSKACLKSSRIWNEAPSWLAFAIVGHL